MRQKTDGTFIKDFPERVILLSDTLEVPTLDNLWNYLSHFYDKVTPALKEQFTFEDLAGIYTENGLSYLCAGCTEENRKQVLSDVMNMARTKYGVEPTFTVQLIVVSGILHWDYEVQVYVDG